MAKNKKFLAGIDVGTTKICSTVARIENGTIEILGTGWAPSAGLKKGIVVNLSETIEGIKASLEEAEKRSQTVVESAYVSVGGAHIRGLNSKGKTDVRGKNKEITGDDVGRAVADAASLELSEDYQVIHVLTQNFNVDGYDGVVNPLGMNGRHLSVHLHLVLNASAVVQNIVNAINKAGVLVNGVVIQQLASAEAVLSSDEKELGTVLVDIGGGTSDIGIYRQGSIWHSEVLPMGGNLITKDIAIGLKAPLREAEELKRKAGSVFPESVPDEELIEVSEVGSGRRRTMSRRLLCQIVQARCDEILSAVAQITCKVGVQSQLVTGVVMTGGGSLLDGVTDRAEQILEMPVRVGYPVNVVSHDHPAFHPAYSTALGLLKYAQDIRSQVVCASPETTPGARPRGTGGRMKSWLLEKIG
ncbi:cell division protein FtsA [Acidobacteria bacterium AH-259-O06]|nr:cell division protein FtsA [Acidobacteria bacterium AH-259-O06]